jgi:hypothetical protein
LRTRSPRHCNSCWSSVVACHSARSVAEAQNPLVPFTFLLLSWLCPSLYKVTIRRKTATAKPRRSPSDCPFLKGAMMTSFPRHCGLDPQSHAKRRLCNSRWSSVVACHSACSVAEAQNPLVPFTFLLLSWLCPTLYKVTTKVENGNGIKYPVVTCLQVLPPLFNQNGNYDNGK